MNELEREYWKLAILSDNRKGKEKHKLKKITRLALANVLGPFGVHWSTFLYILCTVKNIQFISIHSEFNLEAEGIDPDQKHSITFSVGLPQLVYAFVSNMSVLTNSP